MKVRNYFPTLIGCLFFLIILWLICGGQLSGGSIHVYLTHAIFFVATLFFFILSLVVFCAFKEEYWKDLELERKSRTEIYEMKANKKKKRLEQGQDLFA